MGRKLHQVGSEGLALAVPEGVDEDLVVLDGDGADGGAQIECAALEHDAVLVVDAGALGEDEEGRGVGRLHVLPHALGHHRPILHLRAPSQTLNPKNLNPKTNNKQSPALSGGVASWQLLSQYLASMLWRW